ncbi:MAG: hypothetical protein ABIO61_06375 [Thermomonas sp.]
MFIGDSMQGSHILNGRHALLREIGIHSLLIVEINCWNCIHIAARTIVGYYKHGSDRPACWGHRRNNADYRLGFFARMGKILQPILHIAACSIQAPLARDFLDVEYPGI